MAIDLWADLADEFGKDPTPVDPVEWAWKRAGIELWSKQRDIVNSVRDNKKTAAYSAHGTGKSLVASLIAAWWIDTHPPDDTFVISTAPSRDQVHAILWENIRKIHRDADLPGKVQLSDNWLIANTLVGQGRKPQDYSTQAFQGMHRKYLLFILDESCGIPQWIWTAAIANTSNDTSRVLAIGNPDDPSSEFARVCKRDPTWHPIKISVWDSPNFSGEKVGQAVKEHVVQQSYVDDARAAWGESSPLWTSKIEGEFPETNEFAVIALPWVLAAQERWNMLMDIPNPPDASKISTGRKILGVDTARFGDDKTVIATRVGNVFTEITSHSKLDTVDTANLVASKMRKGVDKAIIDMGGDQGAGVFDILKKRGYKVVAFHPGARTKETDESRQLEFTRVRSAAWWKFRDALDPNKEPVVAFPQCLNKLGNDLLAGDLTAPSWETVLTDKIQVESKDDLRKRLGRSTDFADAVIMAWWAKPHVIDDLEQSSFGWADVDEEGAYSWDDDLEEVM